MTGPEAFMLCLIFIHYSKWF